MNVMEEHPCHVLFLHIIGYTEIFFGFRLWMKYIFYFLDIGQTVQTFKAVLAYFPDDVWLSVASYWYNFNVI